MRIATMIFAGSMAALILTGTAIAKNSEAQKADDKSGSASCHAYQQAADGSWIALPCQEFGNGQNQDRPAAKGSEEEPR
jgi:hypothetical protein